jgi:hypothetical protein
MLFAHLHASDDFQLQVKLLLYEKCDAKYENQTRDHHVVLMCEVQCVTKGLDLQVHLAPTTN